MLGVRDRMEIWDRTSYERYEAATRGAYQPEHWSRARAGLTAPTRGARGHESEGSMEQPRRLSDEVRQSLYADRDDRADATRLDRRSALLAGHVG